jgi:hypothetical protein
VVAQPSRTEEAHQQVHPPCKNCISIPRHSRIKVLKVFASR